MNWDNFTENLPLIGTIIGFLILQFVIRRKRSPNASEEQIVQAFLSDIRVNIRLLDVLIEGEQIKKFHMDVWKAYRFKIEFLSQSLQSALTDVFEIAQDYNDQVAAARKYKSTHYYASINTGKMEDRLKKCKTELENWLMKRTGTIEPGGKSSIMDDLFGKA